VKKYKRRKHPQAGLKLCRRGGTTKKRERKMKSPLQPRGRLGARTKNPVKNYRVEGGNQKVKKKGEKVKLVEKQ